ncbi:unnamed protein product [Prorocentrum cordatum]|uniref:Uncharacterized protein n=1 Tax=Prorocentrum cordatum TaxID=2364126 RepID=A0ABN9VFG8_9DINO|nr:unnamed protein product [Polarella glacialis]
MCIAKFATMQTFIILAAAVKLELIPEWPLLPDDTADRGRLLLTGRRQCQDVYNPLCLTVSSDVQEKQYKRMSFECVVLTSSVTEVGKQGFMLGTMGYLAIRSRSSALSLGEQSFKRVNAQNTTRGRGSLIIVYEGGARTKSQVSEGAQCFDRTTLTEATACAAPTASPTAIPTDSPTVSPTATPTASPTARPTASPTPGAAPRPITAATPTTSPTVGPTAGPTPSPTATPAAGPTASPTASISATGDPPPSQEHSRRAL